MAYWNYKKDMAESIYNSIPDISTSGYGLALGFDTNLEEVRLYAEPQAGLVYTGLSLGPVLEVSRKGGPMRFGFQGSGWVNVLVGFDFRYRRISDKNLQAVGIYGKLPVLISKILASND